MLIFAAYIIILLGECMHESWASRAECGYSANDATVGQHNTQLSILVVALVFATRFKCEKPSHQTRRASGPISKQWGMFHAQRVDMTLPVATANPRQHLLKTGAADMMWSMIPPLHGLFYTSVYSETDAGRGLRRVFNISTTAKIIFQFKKAKVKTDLLPVNGASAGQE